MRRICFLYIFFLIVAFVIIAPISVLAITVGPAKIEYRVDPGTVIKDKIVLINESGTKQIFWPGFEKFTEVNGAKQFLPSEPSELANWIKLPESVVLEPGEQKQIPFTIEIPEKAPPGGHFAVIWWGTASPGASQVSIVTRAGILVYLQVSGNVDENGEIGNFSLINENFFIFKLPEDFVIEFRNLGNTYLKPRGEMKIKNIFGSIIADFKVNSKEKIIFPDNVQNLDVAKKNDELPFAFGFYKAEINLQWGEKQNDIIKSIWFFVFPWKTVLIVVLILLALLLIATKGIKKYNQWVIRKYSAN